MIVREFICHIMYGSVSLTKIISGQQLPKPKDSILGDRGEVNIFILRLSHFTFVCIFGNTDNVRTITNGDDDNIDDNDDNDGDDDDDNHNAFLLLFYYQKVIRFFWLSKDKCLIDYDEFKLLISR